MFLLENILRNASIASPLNLTLKLFLGILRSQLETLYTAKNITIQNTNVSRSIKLRHMINGNIRDVFDVEPFSGL